MVVTASSQQNTEDGPRLINLNRDVPQILELLETVFAQEMTHSGRRALHQQINQTAQPAFLWRLNPMSSRLSLGYVWSENGRIVGNITVLTTKKKGRYLIVNVAVHPDFRRRGIARTLMQRGLQMIASQNGQEILLQVVRENKAAIDLYQTLGFQTLGHITEWDGNVSRLRQLEPDFNDPSFNSVAASRIRELQRSEWQTAYALDQASLPLTLNWPEPLDADVYKGGFWRWLNDVTSGRQSETWVLPTGQGELAGLVSIWSEWGRRHRLRLRVHPQWRGQLERPLLAKAVRRFRYLPRRGIIMDHLADDPADQWLKTANFQVRRTLAHMKLTIDD